MKTQNKMVQALIDFLEEKLLGDTYLSESWKHPSPRTFIFQSSIDTIAVYVNDINIVIIQDGENTVDGMEMIRIGSMHHLENDLETRKMVFAKYHSHILDCI